jgi:hypothetical protein
MSKTFRVGEKVILIRHRTGKYPELDGKELIITEPLELRTNHEGEVWYGYGSNIYHKGYHICPRPQDLKRKDDDEGLRADERVDIGSWDKVGWTPHKKKEGVAA